MNSLARRTTSSSQLPPAVQLNVLWLAAHLILRARALPTNRDRKDRVRTKVVVSSFTYTIVNFDLSSLLVERDRQLVHLFRASASPRDASGIVVDCSRHLRGRTRANRQMRRDPVKFFLHKIREFADFLRTQ